MFNHKEGEISRHMDEIHQLKDSVDSHVWFWKNLKFRTCPFVNAVKIWRIWRWVWLHEAPLNQLIKSGLLLHLLWPFRRNCYPWWKFCKIFRLVCQRLKMLKRFMSIKFRAILARQCLFRFNLLVFLQDLVPFQHLRFPSDDGGDGFDNEDEELVRDRMPQSFTSHMQGSSWEGHCGCSFALVCYIRSGSFQCFGFQSLENQLLLIMAKLDISDRDYLAHWLSKAYEVNSDEVIKHDSGCVPRLDRWLAAEISKGLMCLSCSSRSWGTLKDALELETLPGADTCCTLFPGILTLIALMVRCLLRNRFSNRVTVPSICKSFQVASLPQEDWLSQAHDGWVVVSLVEARSQVGKDHWWDQEKRCSVATPWFWSSLE